MDLLITLTLRDVILILIGLAVLIALIYLILLLKNLIPAVKKLNHVLDNAERISSVAADSTEEAKGVVGDAAQIVSSFASNLKGNQSVPAAMTSIVNTLTSIKNLLQKSKKD